MKLTTKIHFRIAYNDQRLLLEATIMIFRSHRVANAIPRFHFVESLTESVMRSTNVSSVIPSNCLVGCGPETNTEDSSSILKSHTF